MDCDQTKEILGAYLDGELGVSEAAQVKEHLSGCEACGEELKGLRDLKHTAAVLRPPPVTEAEWETCWKGVEAGLEAAVTEAVVPEAAEALEPARPAVSR